MAADTPQSTDQVRGGTAYDRAFEACTAGLRTSPAPVDSCAEAARLSEQLGLTALTRALDLARLGQAHLVNKRPSDALPVFLRALALRPTTNGLDDVETADIRQVVAMTYVALGDAKKADEQLALSIAWSFWRMGRGRSVGTGRA